ncbi:MAG TPA: methyl-accepting chemotaxis protein, partial [Spirochaetia bacterium]|nr:methyl-accepting chemotaxis protein [Spirochaetia bacterium]
MAKTKNMTIFVKLLRIFLFLTVTIGVTWVACVVFFYQRSDKASTAHSLANEIDIWMLQARRNEKDFQLRDIRTEEFYLKGTGANLSKHGESVASMLKAIDQLDALHQSATRQTIGDLRGAVDGYNQSFAKLVAAYRERGFADWGAEGDWRTAAHDIESRLSPVGNPALTISLLSVRRHEKDYLLRADDQYVQQLTTELGTLRAGAGRLGEPTRSAVLADIDRYEAAVQHYLQVQNQIGLTENDGLQGGMRDAIHKVEPLVASVVEETKKLSQSKEAFRNLLLSIIAIMAAGLTAGGFAFSLFARSISNPIRKMVVLLTNLAEGDLREDVDAQLLGKNDEIGVLAAALHQTSVKLRAIVATIQESAEQVAASSEELSASSQSLAEGAQSQASTLEETSASVEELTASVDQVSGNAQSQAAAADQGASSMTQVQRSIDEISRSLGEISGLAERSVANSVEGSQAVGNVVQGINLIAESSDKIAGIVTVIAELADQTNLLALNASIEAARAGEHGRGFAVVADEVSKLAERSSTSTKEIELLIKESVKNVQLGVQTARGSQESMEQIRAASQKVKDMIVDLSASMEQQVSAIR